MTNCWKAGRRLLEAILRDISLSAYLDKDLPEMVPCDSWYLTYAMASAFLDL